MRNCAVICEFDPFHTGHKKLIDCALDAADNVICVMSGRFLQSLSPAMTDKDIRARCAVRAGAAAVIELPALYATAGAMSFAEGAIKIISGIKDIRYIAFGAAAPRDSVMYIAETKRDKADEFRALLKKYIKSGKSYNYASAAALTALCDKLTEREVDAVLSDPNSILGIEYICAAAKYKPELQPIIIERKDDSRSGAYRSENYKTATDIRKSILSSVNVNNYIPYEYENIVKYAENHICDAAAYEKMLLFALKSKSAEELSELRDCSDGLEYVIKKSCDTSSLDALCVKDEVKVFGKKRVRRLAFDALLGIKREYLDYPFVTRILAVNKDMQYNILPSCAKAVNSDIKTAAKDGKTAAVLGVDERASALYSTLCGADGNYYNYSLVKYGKE